MDFLSDYDITFELRRGVANQNADALTRLRPCERGECSEPCKQCRKRVTGKHVNIVQTRRQTRLQQDKSDEWNSRDSQCGENFPATKPEALGRPSQQTQPISQVADANHSTDVIHVNDDQCTRANCDPSGNGVSHPAYLDLVLDVRPDNFKLSGGRRKQKQNKPIGLLGRTAPTAAANLQCWNSEQLHNYQLHDSDINPAIHWVESGVRPPWNEVQSSSPALRALYRQFHSLVLINGVLYRIFHDPSGDVKHYQVILPHALKRSFFELIHCDMCAHLGFAKCLPVIRRFAWWYSCKRDLRLFIQCCPLCSAYFRGSAPKQENLHPMTLGAPAERWSIDMCGEFPSSYGYTMIFTAICPFSKFAIVAPLRRKDAVSVARAIVDKIILTHSLPYEILSNAGTDFCNEVSHELYKILGIKKLKTTARIPQTSGCIERWHRTLNSLLAKVVSEHHHDWSTYLNYVCFAYNCTRYTQRLVGALSLF